MAIFVKTKTPRMLVENIKKLIDEQKIDTWSVDSDNDFTHDVDQWRNKAWIRHKIEAGRVVFYVICRKDANMTIVEYAVYHGRFVEMLLAHFDKECDAIEVSPLATSYDRVKALEE